MGSSRTPIIIFLPFFGKFPWYLDFFIHSCRYNPSITFAIITENEDIIENRPKNVLIIPKSLSEIQKRATQRLGFSTKLVEGVKICDYRPAFGYLFPELTRGYAFWGCGDIDVIYGDLRAFLTQRVLNKFDVISFRPEYLTGSFTVWRNSRKINTLFMKSKDYREVFSQSEYFNFDECNFAFGPLHAGLAIEEVPCRIESMTKLVKRKHSEGYLSAYFDFNLIEGPIGNLMWTKGRIFYKRKFEAALYHFLKFKKICKNKRIPLMNCETFCISENNIYKKTQKN